MQILEMEDRRRRKTENVSIGKKIMVNVYFVELISSPPKFKKRIRHFAVKEDTVPRKILYVAHYDILDIMFSLYAFLITTLLTILTVCTVNFLCTCNIVCLLLTERKKKKEKKSITC